MIEIFEKGGIMMYPLILASVLALAIIIERFFSLQKRKVIIPEIISVVEQFSSFKDIELAKNICAKYNGPLSNLIQIGLENTDLERAEIKELIEDQGRQEVRHLEKGLTIIETIAVISPLMGLLGTVLGMIKVFGVIKEQGIGQAAALSGGISEALITTVTGLFVGIPVLIFFNYFSRRAEIFVLDIEKYSIILIQKIHKLSQMTSLAKEEKSQQFSK
ncbi:MAG: MotA/TolQ/ExbB proton channel family protein [Calditrichia bacterium]|nr:MotA/TolQ/ExbB proton channel family protein [Calditrichia bacterium]